MSDKLRAFIGFDLPGTILSDFRCLQEGLRSYGFNMRWVRPENIHLTLKFLGDIRHSDIRDISERVRSAAAASPPLSLAAEAVGVFPSIKRPRVLWTGMAGQVTQLASLHRALDQSLSEMGFSGETRSFKGHLTLARVKGPVPAKKLLAALSEYGTFASGAFSADHLHLFRSDLKPGGPVYSKLFSASLGVREGDRSPVAGTHR